MDPLIKLLAGHRKKQGSLPLNDVMPRPTSELQAEASIFFVPVEANRRHPISTSADTPHGGLKKGDPLYLSLGVPLNSGDVGWLGL